MAIQIRRGTDSAWNSNKSNIVAGEPVITTDTGRLFVGTGSGTYAEFPNLNAMGVRRLGGIDAGSSMQITVPSASYGLLVLHGAYTSQTAIVEIYSNSSGTTYARIMSVPESAATRDFTITTATNKYTVNNTRASGYMSVDFIGINSSAITVS